MRVRKEKKKECIVENKVQFRSVVDGEIDEQAQSKVGDDEFWCLPFSVDDLEDF